MSTSKKILKPGELTAYERWELPVVEEEPPHQEELVTAAQIEAIQQQAYAEAYAQGYEIGVDQGHKDGFAAGNKKLEGELNKKIQRLDGVLSFVSEPLMDVDDAVITQLTDMAITVARQLIRRELHTDPGQIIAVVRESVASLPVSRREVRIYLQPDDAALVRDVLSVSDEHEQSWKIIEDPILSRGGCRIEAEHSKIDATVEYRLNKIIATLLGGERDEDHSHDE